MSPTHEYVIPEESFVRSSAQLYGQYRARLDQELNQRRQNQIIDVTPNRVDLEAQNASSQTSGAGDQTNRTDRVRRQRNASPTALAQPARPRNLTGARNAQPSPETAVTYEPTPNSEDVSLVAPRKLPGALVDFIA